MNSFFLLLLIICIDEEKDVTSEFYINCIKNEHLEVLINMYEQDFSKKEFASPHIFYAIEYDNKPFFDFLINSGVHLCSKNDKGETALHIASQSKSDYYISKLITHGLNPEEEDDEGNTALFLACLETQYENVISLVNHGANINNSASIDCAPILAPTSNEIIIFLLNHGASLDSKDDMGSGLLDVYSNEEVRQLIKSKMKQ